MDIELAFVFLVLGGIPFLIVLWMYGLFKISGAVWAALTICILVAVLFVVYESGIGSATNSQAGGGMLFVQRFLLPPIAIGAIVSALFCYWRHKNR